MKELNGCEDNGKTTIELHPITIRTLKAEDREVKTSDLKKKKKAKRQTLSYWAKRTPPEVCVWGADIRLSRGLGAEYRLGTGAKTS